MRESPPDEREVVITEPLEDDHWYVVDVSFHPQNPIHKAVMYAGFGIKDGKPGAYHYITNPTYDQQYKIEDVHYLKVVKPLGKLLKDTEGGE